MGVEWQFAVSYGYYCLKYVHKIPLMILSNFNHKILAENQLHWVFLVNITFDASHYPLPHKKKPFFI